MCTAASCSRSRGRQLIQSGGRSVEPTGLTTWWFMLLRFLSTKIIYPQNLIRTRFSPRFHTYSNSLDVDNGTHLHSRCCWGEERAHKQEQQPASNNQNYTVYRSGGWMRWTDRSIASTWPVDGKTTGIGVGITGSGCAWRWGRYRFSRGTCRIGLAWVGTDWNREFRATRS